MSYEVATFLKRGRAAKSGVSALDAVMGEDWAIIEPGRARRARETRFGLQMAHLANVERMRSGGGGSFFPGRKPQAVIKMIRNGGASDLRGLRAQMTYLSRDGSQPLQRSETMMGIAVDAEQMAAIEKDWRMPPEGTGRADRTSHFIASFPENTDPQAAERAGRAWAEEMFGSGQYGGDSYDYYTAFHTDRAHPHMHVVVYRRGLENGEWLKVSQRGDMNYDRMREVLVNVAGREGIELEATPRLARGLHDRPVPDAEYRRAGEEGRAPVPPSHTRTTAILAAAALLHQSRRFATEAQLVEGKSPETARILYAASAAASEGKALADITATISNRQEADMSERVNAVKTEIRDSIDKMDRGVERVGDNATRMRLAREIADLKAETAPLLANPRDLAPFTQPSDSTRYRGLDPNNPSELAAKSVVEERVKAVATKYGVDPVATVERYSGPAPSKGLDRQFQNAEVEERGRTRVARGEGPEDVQARDVALSRMHQEIGSIYDAARERGRDARSAEIPRGRGSDEGRTDAVTPDARRQDQAQRAQAETQQRERAIDPIAQRILDEQAAEKRAAAAREAAREQRNRELDERARRDRDNGHGL